MAKKKSVKKSRDLKDWEITAHTIKVDPVTLMGNRYKEYKVHAVFINRYGSEVGYLVFSESTQQYISWDYGIYEEYLYLRTEE